jgi:hypothetical protein
MSVFKHIAPIVLALLGTGHAGSAELTFIHVPFASREQDYLRVDGTIELGDWSRFMRELRAHPGISGVALSSDGGSLDDGLAIAKQVYERSMDTILVDSCHSVCAVIFLAGHSRYAPLEFRLSVHTAYKQIADWTVRDHIANGTVSWFLGHMGYPLALARLWVGTESSGAAEISWDLNDKWQLGLQLLPEQSASGLSSQD